MYPHTSTFSNDDQPIYPTIGHPGIRGQTFNVGTQHGKPDNGCVCPAKGHTGGSIHGRWNTVACGHRAAEPRGTSPGRTPARPSEQRSGGVPDNRSHLCTKGFRNQCQGRSGTESIEPDAARHHGLIGSTKTSGTSGELGRSRIPLQIARAASNLLEAALAIWSCKSTAWVETKFQPAGSGPEPWLRALRPCTRCQSERMVLGPLPNIRSASATLPIPRH